LRIPKIDLDIAVIPVGSKTIADAGGTKTVWADVPNAGGFHRTSAYPGNPGNTVINGHRDILGAVFRHLDRLARGDEITLYVDQATYPYLVTDILVVPETFASAAQRAENLRLIGYMPEERLTLVTCTPVGLATHRLLVIARPPEQAMPQMPEAGTGTRP
jgi:sortase A